MDALEDSGCYDPDDGFFYDRLTDPSGTSASIKVQTLVGVIPALPAVALPTRGHRPGTVACASGSPAGWRQTAAARDPRLARPGRPGVTGATLALRRRARTSCPDVRAPCSTRTRSCPPRAALAVQAAHTPYTVPGLPGADIDYEPAESRTAMYGGNSNWRGPVWFPVNYLVIRALLQYDQFFGPDFTVEYPTGSGQHLTLREIAGDLADRLVSIWLPGPDGRRTGLRWRRAVCRPTRLEGQPVVLRVLSTATTAPASAPCTRPGGPPWSRTCSSTRPATAHRMVFPGNPNPTAATGPPDAEPGLLSSKRKVPALAGEA